MRVAFQADPIEKFGTQGDTTFALMLEAQARGHEVWTCEPKNVSYINGKVIVAARRIEVRDALTDYFTVLSAEKKEIVDFDLYLIRQDPPFDMAYMANTLLLDAAQKHTTILNPPSAVRNVSEKLSTVHLAKYTPRTLIGSDKDAILAFAKECTNVVIKPLFLSGGQSVFKSSFDDENLFKYVDTVARAEAGLVIVQEFIPGVVKHDKRVIFIDGEAVATLGRIPKPGEFRANIHAGGKAAEAILTDHEHKICAAVSVYLKDVGIFLAGVDIIDGYLTEINVTSPTLMREIMAMGGPNLPRLFFDKAERLVQNRAR